MEQELSSSFTIDFSSQVTPNCISQLKLSSNKTQLHSKYPDANMSPELIATIVIGSVQIAIVGWTIWQNRTIIQHAGVVSLPQFLNDLSEADPRPGCHRAPEQLPSQRLDNSLSTLQTSMVVSILVLLGRVMRGNVSTDLCLLW